MTRTALFATLMIAGVSLAACGGAETSTTPPTEMPVAESATPPPAPEAATALAPEGWGPLRIGMTKDEVVAAVGDTRMPDAVGIPGSDCIEFQPQRAPDGLWVMLEGGKLTRITIGDMSPVKDNKALGLHDTAEAVKAAYGDQAVASPHKYQDPPAEYITVWQGGPRSEPYVQDETARGLVYEIDGTGKVGAIHTGGPSIQYVEGCA